MKRNSRIKKKKKKLKGLSIIYLAGKFETVLIRLKKAAFFIVTYKGRISMLRQHYRLVSERLNMQTSFQLFSFGGFGVLF